MPILKPSLVSPNNISKDAREDIIISWQNLGDRSYYYQIEIYVNEDNSLVLNTGKVSSLNTFHIINAGTLTNGIVYKYRITVWNQNDESAISDWIIFKCSSTPTCSFTNVFDGAEILNSSYLFQGEYSQAEGVPIKSWIMILYDVNDSIVGNSGTQYSDVIEYKFEGLHNDSNYKIELQVRSQDDLIASTGKIAFYVRYEVPASSISLQAENVNERAAVRLSWKTIQIIGQVIEGVIEYIDGEKVDLRNGVIAFQEGMPNFRDFVLKLWIDWVDLKNEMIVHTVPTAIGDVTWMTRDGTTEIIRLKSPLGDIWLEWIYEDDTSGRFHLWKNFYGSIYHITTSLLSPTLNDTVFVAISHNGDVCDINAQIL